MAFLRSLLTRRKLLGLALLLVFCGLILWFGGHLELWRTNPLAPMGRRVWLVVLILCLWFLAELVPWLWRRRHEARLLRSLVADGASVESDEEARELQANLQETLAFLRRANPQRNPFSSYAYVLPWYMIVGPLGAGKTELVRQAGLTMPLASQLSNGLATRIEGTGTQWWFTEDAILIGVAGQTVDDAETSPAAGPWRAVLDFLVRHRPRLPADGVIAVLPTDLLLNGDEPKLTAILRRRLLEAKRILKTQLQVYLVVTQCDRLPGFSEAFAGLDEAGREGPLGAQMPARARNPDAAAQLAALQSEFSASLTRVVRALPFQAGAEADPGRRARMLGLSDQLSAVGAAALAVAGGILRTGRYDRPFNLRGIFLTASPAHAGPSPVVDAWAARFAAPLGLSAPQRAAQDRHALFSNGLFKRTIFPEAGLAGHNTRLERRLWAGYAAAYATLAVLMAGIVLLSLVEYTDHLSTLGSYRRVSGQVAQLVADLPNHRGLDSLLPLLDTSREMTELDHSDTPSEREIGVSPLDIAAAGRASDASYNQALITYYLPALHAELAQQLQAATSAGVDRTKVRSLLGVYLMLEDPSHYDQATVQAWGEATLAALYPYDLHRREDALSHFRALLRLLPSPIATDPALVSEARSLLSQRPTAAQIFAQLQQAARTNPSSPNLDIVAALGSNGSQLLMLRPQAGLSVVVPGLFTRDGFYQVFLVDAPALVRAQNSGDWIMGPYTAGSQQDNAVLLKQVTDLYVQAYISQWTAVTNQIYLRAMPDIGSLQAALQTLSGPDSPLITFLQLIRHQTDLPLPAPSQPSSLLQRGVQAVAGAAAPQAERVVGSALTPNPSEVFLSTLADKNWPGDLIRAPFLPLSGLVAPGGPSQGPTLQVQATLATAFGVVAGVATAADPQLDAQRLMARIISGQSADPFIGLSVQSATAPRPIAEIFRELYMTSWSLLLQMSMAATQAAWTRDVDATCQATIAQRYPFTGQGEGAADVSVSDFTAFFAPGGVLDKFVSTNLAMFTIPGPSGQLSLLTRNGLSLGISRTALDQINRGRRLQYTFFNRAGGASARMWLTPGYLDYRLISSTLTYGNTTLLYRHGPPAATQFDWPPISDASPASLQVQTVGGESYQIGAQGPWSLFRLLDQGQLSSGIAPDRAQATFTLNGFGVSYALRAASTNNPFTSTDFKAFRCVPRL